jgi:AP-4 complex subunit epsilon-1
MEHKYPPEYDYHKVPAPWMQMDILKILEKLGKNDANTSKIMCDSLSKCMRKSQNICNYLHI